MGENESLGDIGDPSGVRVDGDFRDVLVGKPGGVLCETKPGGGVPVLNGDQREGSLEWWVVW